MKLHSPVVEELCFSTTVFGGLTTAPERKKKYEVRLAGKDNVHQEVVHLIGLEKICGLCPKVPKGEWLNELAGKGIHIYDMVGTEPFDIEILIGSDLWAQFITGRMYKLACGLIAVEWVFGWTHSGRLPLQNSSLTIMLLPLR